MLRSLWLTGLLLVGCVGDDPSIADRAPPNGTNEGGSSSIDPVDSPDASAPTCVPGCDGDELRTCTGPNVPCSLGCRPEATPRCNDLEPSPPLTRADLEPHGEGVDVESGRTADEAKVPLIFDTKNGSIVQPAVRGIAARIVRRANTDVTLGEDVSGIWFERRGGLAIFRSDTWALRNVRLVGDLPAALVAATDIRVFGRLEVTCGQLGGGAGGLASTASPGPGGGGKGSSTSGGGGGGHDGKGGGGGASKAAAGAVTAGGTSGPPFDFSPSALGGGGGGGGGASRGGGGGGVILLVGGGRIEIGEGVVTKWWPSELATERSVLQGIDVGGCGGAGGTGNGSGGGGGAGGLIVIEAPSVNIRTSAGLAANGGGGGGGGTNATAGARGDIATDSTAGGAPGGLTCAQGKGGAGAAGLASVGVAGLPGDHGRLPSVCVNDATVAGAGGGGGGRIRIATRSGLLSDSSAGVLSPSASVTLSKLDPR